MINRNQEIEQYKFSNSLKVVLVQDWLTEIGGAEKVFSAILSIYPEADVFTLTSNGKVLSELGVDRSKLKESFISGLPFGRKHYRYYLPFFSRAIESFDLSGYDLIISSSSSVAKGVLKNSEQLHICYCHSPVRYAWDLYHQYIDESNLSRFGIKSFLVKHFLHKLRIWDVISANRVDTFIANSNYIQRRIFNIYRRDSTVIYPPIDIDHFELKRVKQDFYFTASRMVPYKRIDLIVKTFSVLKDKKLVVAGTGPDFEKIKRVAGENIEFLGFVSDDEMRSLMTNAKAFVFAANEDFGIIPLEAQACGTPVIAYGRGGALETVVHGKTGIHFTEQNQESLTDAIQSFEDNFSFDPVIIRKHAERFSRDRFIKEFSLFVKEEYEKFYKVRTSIK